MRTLEVSLIEWPQGPEQGGPRLLGRTTDPDLIETVRSHLAAGHRLEQARLESPVRLVVDGDSKTGDEG